MKGINVGGTNYNNLRYADGTALLAENEKVLSDLTSTINDVGKQFGITAKCYPYISNTAN